MVKSQLYLHSDKRELLKSEISAFNRIFNERLFPTFENIEDEAEKYSERIYEELGSLPGDGSGDMSDIAEMAQEKGIGYYMELSLVKYSFTAIAIASLYHLWEQQARKFLYDEVRHAIKVNFTEFCKRGMEDFKGHFYLHSVDLEQLKCWNQLNELRLMSNVIKHGDGVSAKDLRKINPSLLSNPDLQLSEIGKDRPLDTTLLEQRLNVSVELFNRYSEVLVQFWEELPERAYMIESDN
jgi:hypothetical protein